MPRSALREHSQAVKWLYIYFQLNITGLCSSCKQLQDSSLFKTVLVGITAVLSFVAFTLSLFIKRNKLRRNVEREELSQFRCQQRLAVWRNIFPFPMKALAAQVTARSRGRGWG